jgi:hypothetical protein
MCSNIVDLSTDLDFAFICDILQFLYSRDLDRRA